MNPNLSFTLFGDFTITSDEKTIPLRSIKAKALLAYLLVHAAQSHPRESLMTLLWPDSVRQSAQANLRQMVHQLRVALPTPTSKTTPESTPLLLADRQTVQINPAAAYSLDTTEFEALMAADQDIEKLTQAVALYRGPFLESLFVPDSNEFETWAANQRAFYLRRVMQTLDNVTAYHLEHQAFPQAVKSARRQLAIDGLRETAVCQLMVALAKSGRRVEALAEYEQLHQRLNSELGVEPSAETNRLQHQIQNNELLPEPAMAAHSPNAERPPALKSLPKTKTVLLGREEELALLQSVMENPEVSLVSVLGPGGIGKTRLALKAAHTAAEQPDLFSDGIFFVDLTTVHTAAQLVSQIATALNLSISGILPPKRQVAEHLQQKKILLLLDNFEQLVEEGAALLGEWLLQMPQIKILITSRELLGLKEEWVVRVKGLAYPTETAIQSPLKQTRQLAGPESLTSAYPAVALFVSRARQIDHTFTIQNDPATQTAVVQICQLVDGMPLGIELAAPWVHMMSCADIVLEIKKSIDILASRRRDQDPRHRSMRAVFERSWQLLTAVEQSLLAQLSIFEGNFQRQAAQAVCQATFFDLSALVDKSLIQTADNHTYHLHPLLRQFAAEKLSAGQQTAVGHAHAAFYAHFLEEIKPELGGAGQTAALDQIAAELENIRAAWTWQIEHNQLARLQQSFYPLYSFHSIRNRYLEGKVLFETAVVALTRRNKTQTVQDKALAILLAQTQARLGEFYYALGQLADAEAQFETAIDLSLQLQLEDNLAYTYYMLGSTKRLQGYYHEAQDWLRQAVDLLDKEKDKHIHAFLMMSLGVVEIELGQFESSEAWLNQSLWLFERLNYQFGIAHALRHLGSLALQEKNSAKARDYLENSLHICREIDDIGGVALALTQLGRLAEVGGEPEAAYKMVRAGLELSQESREPIVQIRAMTSLGHLMNAVGEFAQANHYLDQALQKSAKARAIPDALHVLLEMAESHLLQGQTETAVPLLQLAQQHPASSWQVQQQAASLQTLLPAGQTIPQLPAGPTDLEQSLLTMLEETIRDT